MRSTFVVLCRLASFAAVAAALLVSASPAVAQQTSTVTDQGTPSALERGMHPLGSYSGGEIDTVNLFNGNLNLRLPLAGKDGRAGLGASVVLSYNSKTWQTEGVPLGNGTTAYVPFNETWDPTHAEIANGWSLIPGRMAARSSGRVVGGTPVLCGPSPGQPTYSETLTTVTFIAPDGTEYSFRDKIYQGRFQSVLNCNGVDRGRVWYTSDGTAATFVSDSNIVDIPQIDLAGPRILSGYVYLRDGTRFKVVDGLTRWQEDRNGNRVNFTYTFSKGEDTWTVTDTLGRTIVVTIYQPDTPSGEFLLATVAVRDATNTERVTLIYGDELGNVRTDGAGAPTYGDLFGPNVSGFAVSATTTFSRTVVSRVELPEVALGVSYRYEFGYNKYGEVAKVILPLGGQIEYDHGGGEGTDQYGYGVLAQGNGIQIYRRVKNRATFVDAVTSSYATKTRYAESFVPVPPQNTRYRSRVVEKFLDSNGGINAAVAHVFEGTPIDNYSRDYGVPIASGQKPWKEGKEIETEYLDEGGDEVLRRVVNNWVQRAGTWHDPSNTSLDNFENDPRLAFVETYLLESGTTLVSKVSYDYDDDPDPVTGVHRRPWNNVSLIEEFDYGKDTHGPLLRQTAREYVTDQAYTDPVSQLAMSPDKEAIVHLRSLLKKEQIKDADGVVESETEYSYDQYSGDFAAALEPRSIPANAGMPATYKHVTVHQDRNTRRGNVTTIRAKIDASRNAYTRHQYDVCGNVVKTFWPRATDDGSDLFSTDYSYDPIVVGTITYDYHFAYVTGVTRYVTERPSLDVVPLTSTRAYYFDTGQLWQVTGENGELTAYEYNDALGRVTREDLPTGGYNRVEYSSPAASEQKVTVYTKLDASRETWRQTVYDGLGRVTHSNRNDVGGTTVSVETRYDLRSRPHMVSNPKRSTDSLWALYRGWTKTTYDALGRVHRVDSLTDETDTPQSFGYTGGVETFYDDTPYGNKPVVRVRDQAAKERASVMDGLGRVAFVVEIFEPSLFATANYLTTYTYDARGNLKEVQQGTQPSRRFTYDGLGRLVTAKMPECEDDDDTERGTTTYDYDEAGNLEEKTDPRGVSIETTYDELNRPLTVNRYSSTTSDVDVEYVYDNSSYPSAVTVSPSFTPANTKGRLQAVITHPTGVDSQQLTGAFYSYDASGRVTKFSQMLGTAHYESTPSYNAASLVTSESYSFPGTSNLARSFAYNDAAQVSEVKRGSAVMAGGIDYVPSGALGAERLGDPTVPASLYHTISYNSRLQPSAILLGTASQSEDRLSLRYTYGAHVSSDPGAGAPIEKKANNGNVARIEIRPQSGQPYFEQNFVYDKVNRLIRAREHRTTGGTSCGGTTTPLAPSLSPASVSGDDVTLTWTNVAGECDYIVKRGTSLGGPYTLSRSAGGADVTSFADTGLAAGTYYYVVTAVNDAGESPVSNEVSAIVSCSAPPLAPSNLDGTNVNGIQVDLTWDDNSNNETKFQLEWRDIDSGSGYALVTEPAANVESYSHTGLVPLTSVQYRIRAVGAGGCPSEWVYSDVVELIPPDQALRTDGINGYAAAEGSGAVTGLNVTGNITVEAWVVLYDTEVNDVILSKHTQGAAEGGFTLAVTETNQLSFATFSSTGAVATSIVSTDTLQIKRWYHVVGEYTNAGGGVIAVFVDGNRTHSVVGTGKGAAASNSALQFGRTLKSDGTGAKHLRGKIDEVRVSNTLRYTANFTITGAHKDFVSDGNTVGLWKMNANTGTTTAVDSSANVYSATLHNGVLWRAGVTTNWVDKRPRRRARARRSGVPLAGEAPGVAEGGIFSRAGGVAGKTSTDTWEQTYHYDQWGNMTYVSGHEAVGLTINSNKNRVTHVDMEPSSYDLAGNLRTETVEGVGQEYFYDANNRMWQAKVYGTPTTTATYVYDGLGRRVKRVVGTSETRFIYNAAGELVAEYEGSTRSKEYAYGPAGLLAVVQDPGASEQIEYTTADHLGTPRVITRGNGTIGEVKARYDYLPFGKQISGFDRTPTNGYPMPLDDVRQRFTGKERDAETGLDYFGARYYGSAQGRFTSVDPITVTSERIVDPQRLNLYAYVRNNPLRYIDPNGADILVIENGPTEGNPIGHTAVAITGYGVFSFGNNTGLGSSPTEYIRKQGPRRDTKLYIIETTPEQDAAAVERMLELNEQEPIEEYPDNCANRSNEALDAAGIPDPHPTDRVEGDYPGTGFSFPAAARPGHAGERAVEHGKRNPGSVTILTVPKAPDEPSVVVPSQVQQFEPTKKHPKLPATEQKREGRQPSSS